jgi:hypothetical protein
MNLEHIAQLQYGDLVFVYEYDDVGFAEFVSYDSESGSVTVSFGAFRQRVAPSAIERAVRCSACSSLVDATDTHTISERAVCTACLDEMTLLARFGNIVDLRA